LSAIFPTRREAFRLARPKPAGTSRRLSALLKIHGDADDVGRGSFVVHGFRITREQVIRVFSIDTRGQDVATIESTRPSALCLAIDGARSQ
jgi:hypothetical protein